MYRGTKRTLLITALATTVGTTAFGGGGAETDLLTRDPALVRSWGLQATEALKAWRINRGDKKILVAVIDTGVDVRHPDLKENIWTNPGESGLDPLGRDKATNGIDDDGNGFIDDVHGWNFASNTNDLRDKHGHGTHIAGIIGAVEGNGIGISGVAPNVSLMVLKYYEPSIKGGDPIKSTVRAIDYAVEMGARIINYSAGGLQESREEKQAIRRALDKGVLFVAAAGNEASNSDIRSYYPADYGLPNILSVTAIDPQRTVLVTSNYGARTVDLAAPGEDILSTLPGGKYGFMTGTSQATAFATGVAALVMAHNPDLRDPAKLIEHLVESGDRSETLQGKTRSLTTLNSYRALAIQDRGVAATGVRADNTTAMDASAFVSSGTEPGRVIDVPTAQLSAFAKELALHVQRPAGDKTTTLKQTVLPLPVFQ